MPRILAELNETLPLTMSTPGWSCLTSMARALPELSRSTTASSISIRRLAISRVFRFSSVAFRCPDASSPSSSSSVGTSPGGRSEERRAHSSVIGCLGGGLVVESREAHRLALATRDGAGDALAEAASSRALLSRTPEPTEP
eukprot:SAG22_NODE_1751_length_3659_cov_67.046067_3_plen_142_part_00